MASCQTTCTCTGKPGHSAVARIAELGIVSAMRHVLAKKPSIKAKQVCLDELYDQTPTCLIQA